VLSDKDPITGAGRDDILISAEDAGRMGLKNGDPITLRNEHGSFTGRARIDRIKPGCLQAHWPEANVIIPAGRLDPSGVPDYNATVELIGGSCLQAGSEEVGSNIAA
jgi:anaerobic selenocysteine-containing dehydrogenase